MGFEVHIKREDRTPITLEEWCVAVDATDGVRLARDASIAVNPKTGDKIVIPHRPGDTEVFFSADDSWIPCLWWSSGRISFKANKDFLQPDSPFRSAVARLAKRLNACLVGDTGEVYD